MIKLAIEVFLLVAAYWFFTRSSIPRQVRNHHHARVATLTKMQAIPRVVSNGTTTSTGTYYAAGHTPHKGTEHVRS